MLPRLRTNLLEDQERIINRAVRPETNLVEMLLGVEHMLQTFEKHAREYQARDKHFDQAVAKFVNFGMFLNLKRDGNVAIK